MVSVVVNVLVLPVVAVAMALTFVTGLVSLVSTALAVPLAFFTNLVLSYIIYVVALFDQLRFAAVTVPEISVGAMIGLYVLIVIAWYTFTMRKQKSRADARPAETPIFFR